MVREHIDAVLLNAYVDDELDGGEKARIEQAATRDPEIARQLALLVKLKSVTAEAAEPNTISLPPPRRWSLLKVAACLAALLVSAVVGWGHFAGGLGGKDDATFARAAHASWAEKTNGSMSPVHQVLALAPEALAKAYFPDLSSAKLRLTHLEMWRDSGDPLLVAGFLGTRGCRVTLMVQVHVGEPAGEAPDALDLGALGRLLLARWVVGGLSYALMAEGMDQTRFQLIAKGVHTGSLRHAPIDKDARMAIARSRATSPPCALS